MEKKKGLIALSGGMDSTTLLYHAIIDLGYDMKAIAFDYGQNHKKELGFAKLQCEELGVPFEIIKLDFLNKISNSSLTSGADEIPEGHYAKDNMKSTVVPFRNGILLSVLTAYAEANDIGSIFLGNHAGDHAVYPDCRKSFIDAFKSAACEGTYNRVKLMAPFINMSKSDICELGFELDVPYELTWSCYRGEESPCGKCGTCVERTEAFLDNDEIDPLYELQDWIKAVTYYESLYEWLVD